MGDCDRRIDRVDRAASVEDDAEGRRQLGRSGHEYVISHFNRRTLALGFLALLQRICADVNDKSLADAGRKGP